MEAYGDGRERRGKEVRERGGREGKDNKAKRKRYVKWVWMYEPLCKWHWEAQGLWVVEKSGLTKTLHLISGSDLCLTGIACVLCIRGHARSQWCEDGRAASFQRGAVLMGGVAGVRLEFGGLHGCCLHSRKLAKHQSWKSKCGFLWPEG